MAQPRPSTALAPALLLLAAAWAAGCGEPDEPPPAPVLATDRPAFDGESAYALVETQVAFGPRVPGTPGHSAQLAWMEERLQTLADSVETIPFSHTHSRTGERLELTNLLARFNPEAERRLLFLAHWDTRPTSDAADTPERQAIPVPGANDGGSGTAVLLQVAAHLAQKAPRVGVDLLFVDGEDFGPGTEDMFLGARHFAANLPSPRPVYGVLLDMVGDQTPRFPVEGYSASYAPQVAQRVWGVARTLGYAPFFPMEPGIRINDDHVPLNEAGLPTVDIIDFDYGPGNAYWHTPEDDVDRVSASTLGMVGEVVLELIYQGG